MLYDFIFKTFHYCWCDLDLLPQSYAEWYLTNAFINEDMFTQLTQCGMHVRTCTLKQVYQQLKEEDLGL